MNKVAKVLQKVEDTIMVVTFAVMALCIFGAVLNRNFIQSPGSGPGGSVSNNTRERNSLPMKKASMASGLRHRHSR